ncbi:recombinase family protein, partial [Catellatospora tritici]|uniref:recombinase family protein n=1 Tax=Catellatospora tritici TaxID=2851566 RepID=UPI001C2D479D
YRLIDAGPHPNPAKASDGRRLHRLEPDPSTAPVVQRIYREFVRGTGLYAIAEGLTRDGILSPSASDPQRNPHRHVNAWGKSAVRVILTNPRYTGRQVWNKQRKTEVLIDVEDVALGHDTKMRWSPQQDWIYSNDPAHEAIIDDDTFRQVQTLIAAGARRPDVEHKPRRSKHSYTLSGLIFCGLCSRRMVGSFNNGRRHYRCTYAAEYADSKRLAHPRSVYLREDKIVELIDPWVARAFSPANLRDTLQAMADSQHDDRDRHRIDAARTKIAGCNTKLDRYRAALEVGTDPVLVQQWIAQAQAEKAAAESELRALTGRRTMTPGEIGTLVEAMSGIAAILKVADPADKAELYRQLGLRLTYEPGPRLIKAEASPDGSCTSVCPRGYMNPKYMITMAGDLLLP